MNLKISFNALYVFERLKTILLELSEIKNLSQWYDFDSISVTQMRLRQWIRSQLDE
jgi:hypothetical protein